MKKLLGKKDFLFFVNQINENFEKKIRSEFEIILRKLVIAISNFVVETINEILTGGEK